jgi:RNA polymerase sigma-70 factor, ECF subfamily
VMQITGVDALEATANQADGSDAASAGAGLPKPDLDDQYLREEILALIPRLQRFARALTHDVVSADDLVQDCLARALEKIHMWEPGTDLRAWLFTILYRQHITNLRRDARQHDYLKSQESDLKMALSPNQTAHLELRELERALAALPAEQRTVLLLVGLDGMEYAEAAAVVNTPLGTVRSRVARGRESLRQATGLFPGHHSRSAGVTANRVSLKRARSHRNDFTAVCTDRPSAPEQPEIVQ